jgi:GWxTD domain-containing protein
MSFIVMVALGTAAAAFHQPLPRVPQPASSLVVHTVRLYRAGQNLTRIKAFVEIPYAMLQPARAPQAHVAYKVTARLTDSTGLTLLRQEWWSHGAADVQPSEASGVEIIDFAVAPGAYRLRVEVQDTVSGTTASAVSDIRGFGEAPALSDLWLSPRMRSPTDGDTVPLPGELREGNTLVTAVGRLILTPLRSEAFYLVEAYAPHQQSGSMSMAVLDTAGRTMITSAPAPVTVTPGGGILKGRMDLVGLPNGQYTLRLAVTWGGDTLYRSAGFTMKRLDETLERNVAEREARRGSDEGYFADMNKVQLDSARGPLIYIAKPGELSAYSDELSLAAKRKLLTAFWRSRDPNPATERNEAREGFYAAVEYANRTFTEGGRRAVPGWRSDRGRIFAKLGQPDDVLSRQQEGTAPRYEIWRYTRERGRYYIFADRTGFGTYKLIATNDLKEIGVANWRELLGIDAVEDVGRYLGINLVAQ